MRRLVAGLLLGIFSSNLLLAQEILVRDNFDRADGPLGASWSATNLIIQSGDVGLGAMPGIGLAWWRGCVPLSGHQSSAVIIGSLDGFPFESLRGVQVFVRRQSSSGLRYGFHYFTGSRTYQIKYDGGPSSGTQVLAATTPQLAPVAGDTLRIEAVGDVIRGYVNDTLTLEVRDGRLRGGSLGFAVSGLPGGLTPRRVIAAWDGAERAS